MDVTRHQAVELLHHVHERIGGLFARLSEEAFDRRGTMGGGEWSAKDLAGHIASWEEITVRSLEGWRRGERPEIEDVLEARAVDRLNEENIAAALDATAEEARERFELTFTLLIEAIEGTTDEEWSARAPYPRPFPTTLAGFLGTLVGGPDRPFGHAYAHLQDLEVYVSEATHA